MSTGEKLHALVLEDDPDVQKLLEKVLTAEGFEVTAVSDGLEGLIQLETLKPNIILCDMMMPNLDGMTFTKAIRAHNDTRHIPVIFLTAKTDTKTMVEGLTAGAKFYLTKPFKHAELIAKVRKAISG